MTGETTPPRRGSGLWRRLVRRGIYAGLVVAALALIVLARLDSPVIERMRGVVTDLGAPILSVIARPAEQIAELWAELQALRDLHAENERLRGQIQDLRQWEAVARQLARENRELRELLNFQGTPSAEFVTARVIADDGSAFRRSLLVNVGRQDGVAPGHAAVVGESLVGRVVEASARSARILLLTDAASRVPVLVGTGQTRAVLAGENTPRPRLRHLAADAQVTPGERVVTSGRGGVFPPGLPVGEVAEPDAAGPSRADGPAALAPGRSGGPRVRLRRRAGEITFVRLIDYQRPGTGSAQAAGSDHGASQDNDGASRDPAEGLVGTPAPLPTPAPGE